MSPKLPKRFSDIPQKNRCGVVGCTPTRYVEAVALRPALSADNEAVVDIIDQELADLKVLILARRELYLREEARREQEDLANQDE